MKIAIVGVDILNLLSDLDTDHEFECYEAPMDWQKSQDKLIEFGPDIVFASEDKISAVHDVLNLENRPSFFVAVHESLEHFPDSITSGIADDFIIFPPRKLALLGKLRWHFHIHALREAEGVNASVADLVQTLQDDLLIAQKIQKSLIKDKFPKMSGLQVKSKYWCGLKSGGDYFDIFEFPDGKHSGFILTESTSYRVSNAFLRALMQFPFSSVSGKKVCPQKIVSQIYAEIQPSMKEKDHFSIFFGVLDRKKFELNFISCGNIQAYISRQSEPLRALRDSSLPALKHDIGPDSLSTHQIKLEPNDRWFLMSDGLEKCIGKPFEQFAQPKLGLDSQTFMNECTFALRAQQDHTEESSASEDEEFYPIQDCSVLLIDIDKNILRLA